MISNGNMAMIPKNNRPGSDANDAWSPSLFDFSSGTTEFLNLISDFTLLTKRMDVGPGARAFFSLRSPQSPDEPYSGFNVCHYVNDDPDHVARCRHLLCEFVDLPVDALVIPRQTHSVNVAVIGDNIPDLEGVDALVTLRDDVLLCVNTADCLPVLFNDPEAGIIAIAHAGWRGLFDGIITNTISRMEDLGAEPSRIFAAIGPHICAKCYEVDQPFAENFIARFDDDPALIATTDRPDKVLLDLGLAARKELVKCGLDPQKISDCSPCTKCHPNELFSARVHGINSGRILTAIRVDNQR